MKKENMELKEVIKAAILEAFAEMYGVATLNDTDDSAPEDGEGNGQTGGDSHHGNNNNNGGSDETSGGGLNNGRPIPDVGVGAFNLR